MPPVIRLIYASTATPLMRPQDEWNILETARQSNPVLGVTGLLAFDAAYFCQLLEGPRDKVSLLFNKIALDRRHDRIELIVAEQVEARLFEHWGMAFAPQDERFEAVYGQFFAGARFDPYQLTDRRAVEFFRALRGLLGEPD